MSTEYKLRGTECEGFIELIYSHSVEIRSGCIAIITRDCDGNGIQEYGPTLNNCPYCGAKIVSKYDDEKGNWDWWHE